MLNEQKLLDVFLESPTKEFNVREVARILKISPATASKKLNSLAQKQILKQRDERMLKLYKADIDSDEYRNLKVFYNINKIKQFGLIQELNKFYLKPTIVLFGSFSTGYDTEESDLDILVISEKTKQFPKLKEFEKKLNKNFQLFTVKKIKDLKNPHLINNILNGIVLQGELKWT